MTASSYVRIQVVASHPIGSVTVIMTVVICLMSKTAAVFLLVSDFARHFAISNIDVSRIWNNVECYEDKHKLISRRLAPVYIQLNIFIGITITTVSIGMGDRVRSSIPGAGKLISV